MKVELTPWCAQDYHVTFAKIYVLRARTRGHRASDIFGAQHPLMCASFNAESARRYNESCNVLHIRDQFHQHFTSRFCTNRSQKCEKTLMTVILCFLKSLCIKADHKHVGEIDTRLETTRERGSCDLTFFMQISPREMILLVNIFFFSNFR